MEKEYVNCNLCGRNNYKLTFVKEELDCNVVQCNECGFVYINPRAAKSELIKAVSGDFYFNLLDDNGEVIARRIQPFSTSEAAQEVINEVISFIHEKYAMEGLHLVEHNLLRPRYDVENLTSEDLLRGINFNNILLEDPYSFVITIILPSGYLIDYSTSETRISIPGSSRKLKNHEFVNYTSRIIRMEAPAHAMVNIFQLDVHLGTGPTGIASLQEFETAYRQWMEDIADPAYSEQIKREKQRILIKVLNKIYQNV